MRRPNSPFMESRKDCLELLLASGIYDAEPLTNSRGDLLDIPPVKFRARIVRIDQQRNLTDIGYQFANEFQPLAAKRVNQKIDTSYISARLVEAGN